jgi:pimeloyl-ACP methyl ester carboxylesterase
MTTESTRHPITRRAALATGAAASLMLASAVGTGPAAAAAVPQPATRRPKPAKTTVVLVHGAFADASSWNSVIPLLQARGYPVYAPANPLRGIATDADYLRTFLSTIPGPITLVGHSYGGAVITNAATGNASVTALVYIAAYALAEGETIGAANELGGGTALLGQHIQVRPFPGSGTTDADAYIDPLFFREVFAQDLPQHRTAVMAATQRPLVASALGTPSGKPAWLSIPSWYLVATGDHAIPPQAEAAMAKRAHAHTVRIASSHVAMLSHPQRVTDLILTAAGCR